MGTVRFRTVEFSKVYHRLKIMTLSGHHPQNVGSTGFKTISKISCKLVVYIEIL